MACEEDCFCCRDDECRSPLFCMATTSNILFLMLFFLGCLAVCVCLAISCWKRQKAKSSRGAVAPSPANLLESANSLGINELGEGEQQEMIERHIKKGVPENDIPIGEPIKSMEVKIFRRDYT